MSDLTMLKVHLAYDRSTPGTHVYKAHQEGVAISALYIRKDGIQGERPDNITVVVSNNDAAAKG